MQREIRNRFTIPFATILSIVVTVNAYSNIVNPVDMNKWYNWLIIVIPSPFIFLTMYMLAFQIMNHTIHKIIEIEEEFNESEKRR